MEERLYECRYCRKEFLPARRRVQKFCSTSCRVKSHHQKTKVTDKLAAGNSGVQTNLEIQTKKTSVDKISFSGVGNAAIGSAAIDVIKNAFTKEENKPATKKDIQNLAKSLKSLKRFQKITNLPPNSSGWSPYFDIEKKRVFYM